MTYILHLLSFLSIEHMNVNDVTAIFKAFLAENKISNLIQSTEETDTLYIVTNYSVPDEIQTNEFGQWIKFVSSFSEIAVENNNYIFIEEFVMSGKRARLECTYKGNKIQVRQSKIDGVWKVMKSKVVKDERDKGVKVTYEKRKF